MTSSTRSRSTTGSGGSYSATRSFTIENKSSSSITYNLSAAFIGSPAGAHVSVSPSKITVPAYQSRDVATRLTLSASAVAALPPADTFAGVGPGAVLSVEGVVNATPTTARAGVYPLHVPFLVVPRGLSNVVVGPSGPFKLNAGVATTNVKLSNYGIHSGTADVYAWGLFDKDHTPGIASVRAVGVQSQLGSFCDPSIPDTDRCLVFAINGWHQWSNASGAEFDIGIDTNGDGAPDYYVVALDLGDVLTGSFDGIDASFTFDASGDLIDAWYADAPMNGSVIELPALASDMGITSAAPGFSYSITGFDLIYGTIDSVPGTAKFNAFTPERLERPVRRARVRRVGELPLSVSPCPPGDDPVARLDDRQPGQPERGRAGGADPGRQAAQEVASRFDPLGGGPSGSPDGPLPFASRASGLGLRRALGAAGSNLERAGAV